MVLFLILTGSHPYDERTDREHTVQPSKPSESSRTATARQSSAQSWVDYRSRNPTGTVGDSAQTEQEKEWRSVEERCARFCVSNLCLNADGMNMADANRSYGASIGPVVING